jgi:hypothetical protein
MQREDAAKINDLAEKIVSLSNEILDIADNHGDEQSREKIRRALAFAVTELDLEIIEPIYQAFPELRPPEMAEINADDANHG